MKEGHWSVPGGRPASLRRAQRSQAETEVNSEGLQTQVLPVAMAGAIFQVSRKNGKFQGEMRPATPRGWERTWKGIKGERNRVGG